MAKNIQKATGLDDVDISLIGKGAKAALKVGLVTWNMGNAQSDGWDTEIFPKQGEGYDIIVIGLQESTYTVHEHADVKEGADSTKPTQTHSHAIMPCYDDLLNQIKSALGIDFKLINNSCRAQMQIFAFARTGLDSHISNVEVRIENTGFMGIFPNKGGLLLCFDVYGTTLAFVSCHLAAHEGVNYCTMRNDTIKEILNGVRVGDTRFDVSNQKHHMFWMGDMNYRVTTDPATPSASKRDQEMSKEREAELKAMSIALEKEDGDDDHAADSKEAKDKKAKKAQERAHVIDLVRDNKWNDILKYDELNRELAANRALAGFSALQPAFPPTFKRKRGMIILNNGMKKEFETGDNADEVNEFYDPKRCPAFTDRILHRSMPHFQQNLKALEFRSFEKCATSDHKPVRGTFSLVPTQGPTDIMCDAKVQELLPGKSGMHTLLKEHRAVELVVTNMKARDLAELDAELFGGGSDPYIIATADPINLLAQKKNVQSSIIMHNLNPDWPAAEELKIPLVSHDLQGMARNAHLFLSVWDYDRTNEDDLIGVCRIPLAAIFDAQEKGEKLSFEEDIYENGEVCGRLLGDIHVGGSGYAAMKGAMVATDKSQLKKLSEVRIDDEPCCLPISCTIA